MLCFRLALMTPTYCRWRCKQAAGKQRTRSQQLLEARYLRSVSGSDRNNVAVQCFTIGCGTRQHIRLTWASIKLKVKPKTIKKIARQRCQHYAALSIIRTHPDLRPQDCNDRVRSSSVTTYASVLNQTTQQHSTILVVPLTNSQQWASEQRIE